MNYSSKRHLDYSLFKARLDAFGIRGGYSEEGDGDSKQYVRVWKQINVDTEDAQRFLEMVSLVFKNMALRVVMDSEPEEESPMREFCGKLKDVPSLYFTAPCAANINLVGAASKSK